VDRRRRHRHQGALLPIMLSLPHAATVEMKTRTRARTRMGMRTPTPVDVRSLRGDEVTPRNATRGPVYLLGITGAMVPPGATGNQRAKRRWYCEVPLGAR